MGIFPLQQVFASQSITLPELTGMYSVGTKSIKVSDPKRLMLRGNKQKEWKIQLFFPSDESKNTFPYMPETLDDGIVQNVKVLVHANSNAKPITTKKLPVILFLPGRGALSQKYTILLEELASHGFLVIAFDQPYVANYVRFPKNEIIVPTLKDVWKLPRNRDYRYAYDDEMIDATIKDIKFILNNPEALGEYEKIFDSSQIILMGHSMGANAAHIFGIEDNRIKLVIDIDSKITERKVYGKIGPPQNISEKPILFIRGMRQYQENVGDLLNNIKNATIWTPNVEHSAFSDDAYFAKTIKQYGQQSFISGVYNWYFKKGPFFSNVDTNIGDLDVNDWFNEYRKHITEWLKTNLATR